jgi:hypothetical protein
VFFAKKKRFQWNIFLDFVKMITKFIVWGCLNNTIIITYFKIFALLNYMLVLGKGMD